MKFRYLFLFLCALILSSCKQVKRYDHTSNFSDKQLYENILSSADVNYKATKEYFDDLRIYYPTSKYMSKALLAYIHSSYINYKFDDVEILVESFIKRYPSHENICYARYMLAMSYYMKISDPSRDKQSTENAIKIFDDVLQRCPNAIYKFDINVRKDYAKDVLIANDMHIGRFYQKKHLVLSALERFKKVYFQDKNGIFAPEALYRIIVCYSIIGSAESAKKYYQILESEHKNSIWFRMAVKVL